MFNKVVWATDGSDNADLALPYARRLLDAGGTLIVVHSDEVFVGPRVAGLDVDPEEGSLKAKVQGQVAQLQQEGIDVKAVLDVARGGHVPPHIAEVAESEGADVIVVGTRGHTAIAGLLLGSVTQRLLHIAPCPVLAVPNRG